MKLKPSIYWMIFCLSQPLAADEWTKTHNQLQIDAERVDHLEQEHRTIYQNGVRMQQKDRQLRADKLILQSEPISERHMEAFGQPVYFQFPDKQARLVQASAHKLSYYPQTQQLILQGQAQIKQGQTHISAEHLVYDLANQELSASPSPHSQLEIRLDDL